MMNIRRLAKFLLRGSYDTLGYFHQSELKSLISSGRLQVAEFKRVLEIGTYEGIFACYAAENFADTVDTIDPFSLEDAGTHMLKTTKRNCLRNIASSSAIEKITVHMTTSQNSSLSPE